jgi:F-box domain
MPTLPTEIWILILQKLSPKQLQAVMRVNRLWYFEANRRIKSAVSDLLNDKALVGFNVPQATTTEERILTSYLCFDKFILPTTFEARKEVKFVSNGYYNSTDNSVVDREMAGMVAKMHIFSLVWKRGFGVPGGTLRYSHGREPNLIEKGWRTRGQDYFHRKFVKDKLRYIKWSEITNHGVSWGIVTFRRARVKRRVHQFMDWGNVNYMVELEHGTWAGDPETTIICIGVLIMISLAGLAGWCLVMLINFELRMLCE